MVRVIVSAQTEQEPTMVSMADLGATLQEVFGPLADRVARQTGCVQRARKFSGASLVQTVVFGWYDDGEASSAALTQMAARRGVEVSAQAIDQRLTDALAQTLQRVLAAATQRTIQRTGDVLALAERFPGGVWVIDSTTIPLPDTVAAAWPGCGGGPGQRPASLKAHVLLNLLDGALRGPDLTPGRASDRGSALQHAALPAGSLRLHDRQYVTLGVLAALSAAASDWLSRYHATLTIADADGTRWTDRAGRLAALAGTAPWVDVPIRLGAVGLAARLVAVRRPQEQADRARAAVKRRAQRNGYTASAQSRALAGWLLVITSVDDSRLSVAEVLRVLRVRWQIERLFRRWKQHGLIEVWHSADSARILCEVLAKLLGGVIEHWLIVVACWDWPNRSLDRASQAVRQGFIVLATVFDDAAALTGALHQLARIIRASCPLTRHGRPPVWLELPLGGAGEPSSTLPATLAA
jgi:hypothetical protein